MDTYRGRKVILLSAKFRQKCDQCSTKIEQGDQIWWQPATDANGASRTYHEGCIEVDSDDG